MTRAGKCGICGTNGPLSYEHVPPEAALNNRAVWFVEFEDRVVPRAGRSKGKQLQRGQGAYTLCASCNTRTGAWYAPRFVDWCVDSMSLLERVGGEPTVIQVRYCYPLAILKQIVAMFCSVNAPKLSGTCAKFLLDRWQQGLWDRLRFFVYYNVASERRWVPVTGMGGRQTFSMLSEISFPPFGYVMTLEGGAPPNPRMFEITWFGSCRYNELRQVEMRLPLLPTTTPFPGDYRSAADIQRDLERESAPTIEKDSSDR